MVLDTLTPAERVAFVLHDLFAVSFDEIAPILGRSTPAARQLASRARRRVRGPDSIRDPNRLHQSALVNAFLEAARTGNFNELLALLDPDVVLRADQTAVNLGAPRDARGPMEVAAFSKRARGAKPALVDGAPAAIWTPANRPRVLWRFTISGDKITAIDIIATQKAFARSIS